MSGGALAPRKTYSDVTSSTLRPWVSLEGFIMSKSYLLNRGDTVDHRARWLLQKCLNSLERFVEQKIHFCYEYNIAPLVSHEHARCNVSKM